MFKSLVGKGHPEFSTAHQQDAVDFLQYLFTLIERKEKLKGTNDPTHKFKFKLEDRLQCSESNRVKYSYSIENVMSVPVPMDKVKNKKEYEDYLKAKKLEEQKYEQLKKEELKKLGIE